MFFSRLDGSTVCGIACTFMLHKHWQFILKVAIKAVAPGEGFSLRKLLVLWEEAVAGLKRQRFLTLSPIIGFAAYIVWNVRLLRCFSVLIVLESESFTPSKLDLRVMLASK